MKTVDPLVPISLMISRMEKHQAEFREIVAKLPWWRFKRRAMACMAIAVYDQEIDALLALAGSCQPIIGYQRQS